MNLKKIFFFLFWVKRNAFLAINHLKSTCIISDNIHFVWKLNVLLGIIKSKTERMYIITKTKKKKYECKIFIKTGKCVVFCGDKTILLWGEWVGRTWSCHLIYILDFVKCVENCFPAKASSTNESCFFILFF